MKIKRSHPNASGKSIKLLSYYRKPSNQSDFEKMNSTIDSVGSGIKIISGNLESLKPFGHSSRLPTSSEIHPCSSIANGREVQNPGPSTSRDLSTEQELPVPSTSRVLSTSPIDFTKPLKSSTPKYEIISDAEDYQSSFVETTMENIEPESESVNMNITFNAQEDIFEQQKDFANYMKSVDNMVRETQEMVRDKSQKRVELYKKLSKYRKKQKHVEKAIKQLDKIISFGLRLPRYVTDF